MLSYIEESEIFLKDKKGYAAMNFVGSMSDHIIHKNPFSVNRKRGGFI